MHKFTVFAFFLAILQVNGEEYRSLDIMGFRITLEEISGQFFVSVINMITGDSYTKTLIYQDLERQIVVDHFNDTIILWKVTTKAVTLQLPIMKNRVDLDLVNETRLDKSLNLLSIRIGDQKHKNKDLRKLYGELKNNVASTENDLKMFENWQTFGRTASDSWMQFDETSIYVEVDISELGLKNTPIVQTYLVTEADVDISGVVGGFNVYEVTNTSFKVALGYSEMVFKNSIGSTDTAYLTVDQAVGMGLTISYVITPQDS